MIDINKVYATQATPDPNAKMLDLETLKQATEEIQRRFDATLSPDEIIEKIHHNCEPQALENLFKTIKILENPMGLTYYGLAITQNPLVPENEIWFMNKKGFLYKRFKI